MAQLPHHTNLTAQEEKLSTLDNQPPKATLQAQTTQLFKLETQPESSTALFRISQDQPQ